jgi:predicted nucleotidyltransferase
MKYTLDEVKKIISHSEPEIRKFGVKEIYLFGSVVRGESKETSDVDFFVVFEEATQIGFFGLIELQIFLESKLKTNVDIGTKNSLHRLLKDQILKEAVRVA